MVDRLAELDRPEKIQPQDNHRIFYFEFVSRSMYFRVRDECHRCPDSLQRLVHPL